MIRRAAFLSLHTSPLVQPGSGDGGGMNVYIDELARTMVDRGVEVDVFTRATAHSQAVDVEVTPGYRVVQVAAGPRRVLPMDALPVTVQPFADGVIDRMRGERYEVVHSHYWLSGWAGLVVKRAMGIPLANSFHTLGRVKDATRRVGEPAESLVRIAAEHEVIAGSDCVIASTPHEADDLTRRYGADPARLCVTHPGVNHDLFTPGSQQTARKLLGWENGPVLLFVGRIQPLKGLDVAVETFGRVRREIPAARLAVVGGPSGPRGEAELQRVRGRVEELRLEGCVEFIPARPHQEIAAYYRAADVLLVPSRSESFGLVAAEAQACGLPVVAARVGGLAYTVEEATSGFLVDGWDPEGFASAAVKILLNDDLAARLSKGAVEFSERFSWEVAAERLLELYAGITAAV
ncbi:MAG TPA: glycosyltransferase [Acidimicrobiia bacterium]|nr:glycosyltransferase [Acidimicrobiia bacterium]